MNQNPSIVSFDYIRQNIGDMKDLALIFLVSIPLSILLYILFSKYRHYMLVDLGDHKWLIK